MDQEWKAIHRIADRLAPDLRRAFLAAVEQLRGRVSVDAVATASSTNRIGAVEFLLDPARFAEDLRPAVAVVNEAFAQAGKVAAAHLGPRLGEVMAFDRANEQAIRAIDRVGARLVREVTEETRDAIREVIKRGFRQGIPPRDMARIIRDLVGLTERQQQAVINYRFGLLQQNLTSERVERLARVYARKKLRERATNIARTETINASNEGQLELWRQARREGALVDAFKVWITTPDDRRCKWCRALEGQRRRLDEPFVSAYYGPRQRPTLHPQCRCAMGIEFKRARVPKAA